jgi:hypothetical protein
MQPPYTDCSSRARTAARRSRSSHRRAHRDPDPPPPRHAHTASTRDQPHSKSSLPPVPPRPPPSPPRALYPRNTRGRPPRPHSPALPSHHVISLHDPMMFALLRAAPRVRGLPALVNQCCVPPPGRPAIVGSRDLPRFVSPRRRPLRCSFRRLLRKPGDVPQASCRITVIVALGLGRSSPISGGAQSATSGRA